MAITIREYLGDEKIAQLENMGFLPSLITDMAKRQYAADKQAKRNELSDAGLDGKLVQGIMRGDINEKEAKNAQKFEDFGSKKHGWGLGAAKTLTGIANTLERAGDFINPFYDGKHDENGNYIYQNSIEQALRPKIKNAEKLRDDYEKATGETAWGSRLAEIGTEMVGDPINFIGGAGLLSKGSKLAQFGKKTLFFAGTGAASGGVMALGEGKNDEETLKNIGYGAAGGFVLGHAIDQGIQGISKLIAKRQASKMANEADAIDSAQNSEFLGGERAEINTAEITARKDEPLLHAERSQRDYATKSSPAQIMTAKEFATKEMGLDEGTATNVLKEAMQGKEKSEFIDADSYNDIVKFKNFEVQREYAKAYGEKIQTAQTSINNAREQSAIRYADTQKAINEYVKQGMSASATRELINAKFKPSADEINYTRAYNDGVDVDARLTGQGIFYALEKDIAAQAYTPEIYATRLKQRVFSDESVQAFTQAYANKDIDIAKEYVNKKVADAYESRVQREVADEIKAKNEVEDVGLAIRDGEAIDKPEIYEGNNIMDFSSKIDDNFLRENATELEPSGNLFDFLAKTKNNPSRDKILNHFADKAGEGDSRLLEHRMAYLNYIMPTIKEPLIKIFRSDGRISNIKPFVFTDANSKTKNVNFLSIVTDKDGNIDFITAYALKDKSQLRSEIKKGIKVEVRRGLARTFDPHSRIQVPNATKNIIPQKGNLINEEAKNSTLPNGVSSIGDNASRAGGRQRSDEEILRQSGRNTADASEEKWTAKSDRQMEQRPAFKGDGKSDAAAASKQMVEKQGRDDEKVGDSFSHFTIDDVINKKLNFINKNNLGKKGWLDDLNLVIKKYGLKDKETKNKFMSVMIRDKFKYNREFHHSELKDVMPRISPLNPKYPEISNNAYKELNEIIKNKTIPATKEQNLRFFEEDANGVSEDALHLHAGTKPAVATGAKEINAKTINANSHIASGLVGGTLNSIDEDGSFNPEKFAAGFIAGLAGSKAVAIAARKMTPQLYNKILGVANKMPQMAKDNPKLLGKLYANGKGVSLNSFAGEKAITANVGKLDQAKAMLEKGADEVEIWQKTGWFKDKDGAWKFEIGDNKARLNPDFQSGGKLGELLDHEELFKAYPELKDVMVVKIGGETPDGAALSVKDAAQREKRGIYNVAFNNKKSTIIRKDLKTIDEIIKFEKGEADYVVNGERKNGYGALHIQKHLDTQNNGWVTKQEYLDMGQMLRKSTMQEADDKRIYTYFNDEGIRFRLVIGVGKNKERVISFYSNRKPLKAGLSYNSQNYDGNLPLNDDIIAQNGTKGYYRPSKNEIGLSDLGDKSALMHEVQHAIQEIEGFARGGNTNKIESSLWFKSGELAYKLKKLAPPPEFYVLEKKRSSLSSKLMLEADKIIEQNPLMEDNIIENTFNKKNFDKLKLRNTKELKEFKDVLTKYHETDNALGDMVKNHPIFKERKNITDQIDALTKKDSYEEYKKLHGEVEARNVQNRLNLDGKTHPHETFDVNPNETIVSKEDGISYSRRIEEIKSEHPNVEKELDESIATINKESFNDSNFKDGLIGKFDTKEITTQQLGKSINLSNKQLTILKNDIKNADFKVINESKIYFDKIGKDGDKKRFFVDIAEDGNLRVDAYAKSQIDNIPVKQSALEELAGTGDAARLKNMSFEVKAAYHNELDPIKKEAILKTAELNKLKKAAQSGDKVAVAKFEEFKAKNLDKDGNIKDGLRLC